MSIEQVIFNNQINNEDYGRKVIPFLKKEYFQVKIDQVIFELINNYVTSYNAFPTKEVLMIDLSNYIGISDEQFTECKNAIDLIPAQSDTLSKVEWLIDQTEDFCKENALYNAITKSIEIMGNKANGLTTGAIPDLLSSALAVSFDTSIGHDFLNDTDSRFEFYHRKEERIPFDIDYLNKITKGGLPRKTLNVILAGTGVGKSLAMCHMASSNLLDGKNVLYITMEMAEEKIAERIDANLLNMPLNQLFDISKDLYDKKINRLREKTVGKLIIKEYPTACAGSANFRHLLNELKIKKNFIPDIIYIDYLNICSSSRMRQGGSVNSYTYIKAIAEELRGLAVEFNVPVVTATQTTRGGYDNSDIGLTDTSESFGLPATADLMIALISTDELKQLNQMMVKQLKNRYADPEMFKRFIIGVDKSRMKLYDAEQSAQNDLMNDAIVPNTSFGQRASKKPSFDGFK
jgi:archaellum biogenesis ATPase FlaH